MGSQRAFRHNETQLVSQGVTGFTPLRDYAATFVAPDRAFPNYESNINPLPFLNFLVFQSVICSRMNWNLVCSSGRYGCFDSGPGASHICRENH
jgi:hypothetical protein